MRLGRGLRGAETRSDDVLREERDGACAPVCLETLETGADRREIMLVACGGRDSREGDLDLEREWR